MMANLREMVSTKSLTGRQYGNFVVKDVDDFRYEDPIDLSVSEKQVRSHYTTVNKINQINSYQSIVKFSPKQLFYISQDMGK